MKMDPFSKVGQGDCLRLAASRNELGHIIPAGDMERSGELTIYRVLHDHIQNSAALVHNSIELHLHLVGPVTARKGYQKVGVGSGEQIPPGGGGNLKPTGPQKGHIPHDNLTADRQFLGKGGGADGGGGLFQPPGDFGSSLLGVHKDPFLSSGGLKHKSRSIFISVT